MQFIRSMPQIDVNGAIRTSKAKKSGMIELQSSNRENEVFDPLS